MELARFASRQKDVCFDFRLARRTEIGTHHFDSGVDFFGESDPFSLQWNGETRFSGRSEPDHQVVPEERVLLQTGCGRHSPAPCGIGSDPTDTSGTVSV